MSEDNLKWKLGCGISKTDLDSSQEAVSTEG